MSRWEPNARGRLEQAAMELYVERGFEQTTVAEIAARAGLTERTFFRHFTDKREVLFWGAGDLRAFLVDAIAAAPAGTTPIDMVIAALEGTSPIFQERGAGARQRQAIIDANPELRERELIKLTALASAMAAALRERGVPDLAASLTAEAGIAVFRVSFERWIKDPGAQELARHIRESRAELEAAIAGKAHEVRLAAEPENSTNPRGQGPRR